MPDYKISIASYSFHGLIGKGKMNVFHYLDLLKFRYHVDWADIYTSCQNKEFVIKDSTLESLDHDYLKSVRRHMDSLGMGLANLCVDGPYVWHDDPERRAAHKKRMLEFLKAAEILGAKTVRIDFGGPFPRFEDGKLIMPDLHTMTDEAFEYIVDTFREYCQIVESFGCKIGPENHWGWDRVPGYIKKVREAVDHPAYGHLYHIGNFADDPEEGEAYVIPYTMHTHIHANAIPAAKEVVRKLALSGYQGTYGVEHHSGKYEAERVEWQLGSLRAIIAELRDEDLSKPSKEDMLHRVYAGKSLRD